MCGTLDILKQCELGSSIKAEAKHDASLVLSLNLNELHKKNVEIELRFLNRVCDRFGRSPECCS